MNLYTHMHDLMLNTSEQIYSSSKVFNHMRFKANRCYIFKHVIFSLVQALIRFKNFRGTGQVL